MIERRESASGNLWPEDLPKRFGTRDLFFLVYLPVMTAVAWLVPERLWDAFICRAVTLAHRVRVGRHRESGDKIACLLEGHVDDPANDAVMLRRSASWHRARLHILRCHWPRAWQPEIVLSGSEHIEAALQGGHGAILWVAPFVFSDLLTKLALHRAGFQVAHLSRVGHGFSPTAFGRRLLNPIWTAVENRHLAGRLEMSPENSIRALQGLVQRVRRNQIVSVTVGNQGQHTTGVRFANGTLALADALPGLALRTGAALLPVFTVRQPDGSFLTRIEPTLRVDAGIAADGVAQLIAQEAALLESWALRYPHQFVIWEQVELKSSAGAARD